MKKIIMIFFIVLVFVITIIGCKTLYSGIDINDGTKKIDEKNVNMIIEEYNKKYKTKIEKNKLSIYNIKPYKNGFLVLIGYKDELDELKLLYLEKDKNAYHISKESDGQHNINKLQVNKVELEDNTIYFGKMYNTLFTVDEHLGVKDKQGKIIISLDDGKSLEEKMDYNQGGYIIIAKAKAMVVDLYLLNSANEKKYFIKNFINYSDGINECLWK